MLTAGRAWPGLNSCLPWGLLPCPQHLCAPRPPWLGISEPPELTFILGGRGWVGKPLWEVGLHQSQHWRQVPPSP